MTHRELLLSGRERLNQWGGTDTPDLDASLLLCHALGTTREKLFARLTDPVDPAQIAPYDDLILRRTEHFPVAYLLGNREFFGRPFHVEPGVLCPRPDTEVLVEKALALLEAGEIQAPRLLDLCSGTGCIGLTMAAEIPQSHVVCADIDETPERVFARNRASLKIDNARFVRSDLLENVTGPFDMILTNPPYLTRSETNERMNEGWKEPALALDGGADGLDLIRKIIAQSIDYLLGEGYLLIEADPRQMVEILRLMEQEGFVDRGTVSDLGGHERVAYGRKGAGQ